NQCRLHISNPEMAQKDKVLFISDLHGRGVLTQRFSGDEWLIDTSGYPSGIYLVYIMMDGNVLKAEKLVISR
ncbi:MAG: T9SS type A sorting domain-containing protein, partial [Bacteroidales bacterium]